MTALYAIGDFVGYVEPRAKAAPLPKLWYMLRLHPNYDLKAERQLTERGISVYVPKEKRTIRSTWSRYVLRDVPIFAGAMFVPDFEADLPRLKTIASGIGGFVKRDGTALRISLAWMDRIRAFEAKMHLEPGKRRFHLGQDIRIKGGLFDLWEGRIERLDRHHRIRVLIETLAGEVSITLDEDQVEAV